MPHLSVYLPSQVSTLTARRHVRSGVAAIPDIATGRQMARRTAKPASSRSRVQSAPAFLPIAAQKARHAPTRSEEHTSELQALMRTSYDVFCLKKKNHQVTTTLPVCSLWHIKQKT